MKAIALAAVAAAMSAAATQLCVAAAPQDYPSRPIRLLVPSPPGGSNDGVARIVANGLSRTLGRNVVVDNRPGGGGIIASETVARALPDGHTLLFAYAAFTTTPFLASNLPYDVVRDFAPITEIANQPLILVAHPSVPANSVKELIALAQSRPGGLTAAHTQIGSATHLATELFRLKTNTTKTILAVSYKGGGPAQIALLSGEAQISLATVTSSLPQIKSGKLKPIATSAPKRLPYLPEVATFEEMGVKGIDVTVWQGLLAPAKTPRPIVERIYAEVRQLLTERETLARLAALGSDPLGSSPTEFGAKLERELLEFGKLIGMLGLKPAQ
jgi:tripartite-type tricarboxylate transporter receptor subunit TctC